MLHPRNYFHFYIGAQTDSGILVGAGINSCTIQTLDSGHIEMVYTDNFGVRLYLRTLQDLSRDESAELIRKGMSIGRPRGYSFSPEAFLYLLSCRIDLFGLIENNLAIHMKEGA